MVGAVPHFAPSGAPPPGQKTETRVPLVSQLTAPSACTAWTVLPFFRLLQSPVRDIKGEGYQPRNRKTPLSQATRRKKPLKGPRGADPWRQGIDSLLG